MKIVATIEARMSSTRLPGKVLRRILGKSMLELMIERVRRAKKVSEIVIATTTSPVDDSIVELAERLGVGHFRGDEDDVLGRVLQAAESAKADVIVELTGDSPLIDPEVIDQLTGLYLANRYDYVSNNLKRTFPLGLDTQVFSTKTLALVAQLTRDPVDREHVSLYIYKHPERFALFNVESGLPEKYRHLRLTVDTVEDFALIEKIYETLYPGNPVFTLQQVLALFDTHPELAAVNRHISQKKVR